jgi:3-methyladenine DNA glycosylase AlkD
MKANDFIPNLIEDLKSKSDPDYRDFTARMIPTHSHTLGVRTPDVRKIIKKTYPEIKELPSKEFLKLIQNMKATGIFELIQISHEYIAKNNSFRKQLTFVQIEKLLIGLDNWASVDSFAGYVSGPAWIDQQIRTDDILKWSAHENVWIRRLAIVSCVPLNQKSQSEIWKKDITLELCQKHLTDREPIIHKAISWALRSLVKDHSKAVENFLIEHENSLKNFVRKEVMNKIKIGKKN